MSEIGQKEEQAVDDGRGDGPLFPSSPIQREIEVILARQLTGYLALPVIIMDSSYVVVYYNEPAERILGRRFDEGGAPPLANWTSVFEFTNEAGQPMPAEQIPVASAIRERRITHARFWLRGNDGARHHVEGIGIPLIGNAGRFLGAISVFDTVSD
jgi:PAS domain-containing protein